MSQLPRLDYGFAKKNGVLLLDLGETAVVGLREGGEPAALIETRRALRVPLRVELLSRAEFERRLSEAYAGEGLAAPAEDFEMAGGLDHLVDELPATADLLDAQDDAPIIRLINGVLAEAVRQGASDVHIEPFETALVVRLRVDGLLKEVLNLSHRIAPLLVSRVKVMARLDIAEKRVPQDGRISLTLGGRALDVRVSTLPARAGERVVMRILDQDQAALGLEDLGMSPRALEVFRGALRQPNGVILVTGPTGSGKTTTLYAGLSLLNDATRNILTIEDPVEYAIQGLGQTQVNAKVGMTFAAGLRAILRQDPDVVMVGEIRDVETAQIAVQASLTGHLVLSTVHTNDAAGAVTRLRDMGVEPFLLASTVRAVIAQRLVRRLCTACRRPEPADAATARMIGMPRGHVCFRPVGCPACGQTGYVGRVGVYEALRVDDRIRRLVAEDADEDAIAKAAFPDEGGTLQSEARRYVAEGITTVEEAIRVSRQESAEHVGV
ncbi:type II secretion system ATPase GspE [Phenylobacterium sp.]|uniref:type II secretion system ATPase GspE n=1 Tax=Phenylobacterium sp. TaxID=1871053 RepID=UPI002811892E|nr:type II secretion system ATPase GspE [Phenylobacterium sp.]